MEFRILGPVEADVDGRAVDLGGFRERTLFARLVLSANHVVPADRLADDLWAGSPPPHSGATLRVYIARLRRALGAGAQALVTQPPGYRLDVAADNLDAERFAALADAARAELAAGNAAAAAVGLREALALWRGPALSDIADIPFAQPDALRLDEARLAAVEGRIAADLACGRHESLIAELDALALRHPLRERICGQQILALYRCGRQADALAAYGQLRARLAEELGIDPTPELRELHGAILRQEPCLDWHPAGGNPAPAPAARPGGGRAVIPQAETQGPPGMGLPAETSSFVGRESTLGEISDALSSSRLVTLTGPGGSGKSRLALRAAARLAGRYADGAWMIQLASVLKPDVVTSAVAAALSVREQPERPLLDTIAAEFAGRQALLVLDNCEHLLEATAEVAAALLASCRSVRIMATSQVRLRVDGEACLPVPPLSLPAAGEHSPASVLRSESARLFCDRAASTSQRFTLTTQNASAVAEICRRLDGIPLAVELAAARVGTLTAGQLSARLDDRFCVLTGGSRTGLPRHRTLLAALNWSHDLLTGAEQACFRRMAVFAGGCTLDAAEAVCPGDGPGGHLPRAQVFEAVASLVDRSLLTTTEQLGSVRYSMLESVRQYAMMRLGEAGEEEAVLHRLIAWARDLVRQADLDGPDQGAWLDLLAADHDNFVAGLEWGLSASGTGQATVAVLALAAGLAPFWKVRGYIGQGQRWLVAALDAAGSGIDQRTRAAALDGAGLLAAARADHDAQRGYQEESLAIWTSLGEDARIAGTLADLGSAAHTQAEYSAAHAMFTEALRLARRADDAVQTARSLSGLGVLALHRDELDRATAYFQEAMSRFVQAGDLRRATLILGNLGVVAINSGDFELAVTRLREHLVNSRRLGDRKLIAGSLTNLGMALHRLGDLDRADEMHHEALDFAEQVGDRRIASVALTNLGLAAFARRDLTAATAYHRRSLALAEAVGEPRSIAESLAELAEVSAAQGSMHRAATLIGAAQAIREEIGAPAPGPDLARYNRSLAAAELRIGTAAFAAVLTAGRQLAIADAVRYAMTGAPSPVYESHGTG